MLRPAMSQIVKKDESAYEFVIEVARRAREIVNEAEERGEVLDVKPVQLSPDSHPLHRQRRRAVIPKTESIVRSNTGRDSQPVFLVSGSRKGV